MPAVQVLRRRFILGTAVAGVLMTGYGRAFAGSCTVSGGTYLCSGPATSPAGSDTPITIDLSNPVVTASTYDKFGIDSASTAITIHSDGDSLSFTDNYKSTITGADDGIAVINDGSGEAKLLVTGTVSGTGKNGIALTNSATASGVNIITGPDSAVTGASSGIYVLNKGTGQTIITANGDVAGASLDGIYAGNASSATKLIITTGAGSAVSGVSGIVAVNNGTDATAITTGGTVTGTNIGIYSFNNGTSSATITVYGTATGKDGIKAVNAATAADLIITTGADSAVTGTLFGIYASNKGKGETVVSVNGDAAGTDVDGIYAVNSSAGTKLTITTGADSAVSGRSGIVAVNNGTDATAITTYGSVAGANIGIYSLNNGTAATTITANGTVTGKDGIKAVNTATAAGLIVTTGANSAVTGTLYGIYARNKGSGQTIITANGDVTGTAVDAINVVNSSQGSDLIVTTGAGGTVTGARYGIYARNKGDGKTIVTANGAVTGTAVEGIYAVNSGQGTDLIVTTGADSAVDGLDGLVAKHYGTGATTITANGAVAGTNIGIAVFNKGAGATTITANGAVTGLDAIEAINDATAGDLIITTGAASALTATNFGIFARNDGAGQTIITANGAVTGSGMDAIYAVNAGSGTTLIITTGAGSTVTGPDGIVAKNYGAGPTTITTNGAVVSTDIGITAYNKGSGSTTITANGAVTAADAIQAINDATAGDLIITTGAASTLAATNFGIYASNNGTGETIITANGAVSGAGMDGIRAANTSNGSDVIITTGADSKVAGRNFGIHTDNDGTQPTTITTAGLTQGGTAAISARSGSGQAIIIGNSGTLQNSSGSSSALAVQTAGGATTINNAGTTIGTVALGDFGSVVNNTGIWNTAGGSNDFGTKVDGNGLDNTGTIVAADDATAAQSTVFDNVGTFANNGILTMGDRFAGDTTTINGNFSGIGTLVLDARLGANGSSDLLVVNGSILEGTNVVLKVSNIGGDSGLATDNGVEVVEVVHGTSPADAFHLDAAVGAGIYDYGLYYSSLVPSADDQNWYLRSTGKLNASTQTVLPYADMIVNFAEATLGTLQQRNSNRIPSGTAPLVATNPPSDQAMRYAAAGPSIPGAGAWGRAGGQYGAYDPKTGSSYTQSIGFLQAGYEGTVLETTNGQVTAGAFATVGTSRAEVDVSNDPVTGAARARGKITSTGYGLGANLTWFGYNGLYIDGVGQFTLYDTSLSNKAGGNNAGWSSVLSLETGKRFDLGSGWAVVPQAQLTWTHVDFSSFTDIDNARIDMGDGDSLKGRIGVRVENLMQWRNEYGSTDRLQFYGTANLFYQFLNGTSVDVAGTSLTQGNKRLWGEVGFGGSYAWNDSWSLYGEADYATALSRSGGNYTIRGTAGLRYKW